MYNSNNRWLMSNRIEREKEPSIQVHKSLWATEREIHKLMLRHYYNQFLFILQFSDIFSFVSSFIHAMIMWCVQCCNNVPFLWHRFRWKFFSDPFCLLNRKMLFEIGSKAKIVLAFFISLFLVANDVLKSRMNSDGLV